MADFEKESPAHSSDEGVIGEKGTPGAIISSEANEELHAGFGVNERALLRKLDLKLLPAVTLLYLLSFLDRSNGIFSPQMIEPSLPFTD